MKITSQMVKELRDKTNAGMMDCKRALGETEGDMEKAVDLLRQKGLAVAQKRADRATSEGVVECYIHAGSKLGVMVELGCETDFVAKTDDPGHSKVFSRHDIAHGMRGEISSLVHIGNLSLGQLPKREKT